MTAVPQRQPVTGNTRFPAEWENHAAIWTAWPSHADLWQENLDGARTVVAAMIRALSDGDAVKVLACGPEAMISAHNAVGDCAAVIPADFGDIWLRDTGPIFTLRNGRKTALRFRHNGWGGKYVLEHDDRVGDAVAALAGTDPVPFPFVLEGGAIENNGDGTLLTTRQCVLNPNRNPGWNEHTATAHLCDAFGAHTVLWLDDGLLNDHTDVHIDNIARFIGPPHVLCQSAADAADPNARVLAKIEADLHASGLQVDTIPSPGRVENEDGDIIPASHMNFMIGNKTVVMPTYGTPSADAALAALQSFFPAHRVVGVPSIHILSGGGSFHCIIQQ